MKHFLRATGQLVAALSLSSSALLLLSSIWLLSPYREEYAPYQRGALADSTISVMVFLTPLLAGMHGVGAWHRRQMGGVGFWLHAGLMLGYLAALSYWGYFAAQLPRD